MSEILRHGARVDGRYVLQTLLGEGTFGGVWRAQDTRLSGRLVAVKFLKPEFLEQPTTVARFEAEGEALARVSHPNIVAVIDRGTWESQRYIVTEFIDGHPLSAWIAAERAKDSLPAVEHCLAVFDQLCAGMEAAHAAGPLVHRDLKPDNVIVREVLDASAVKIVDFGIAQLGGRRSTRTGAMMGTPLYMAPEQAMGNTAAVGPWTDVFALGVILAEMLTLQAQVEDGEPWWGTALHRGGSVRALLAALRPDVPGAVWDVVATCLKAQGRERFQHAGALRVAMRDAAVTAFGKGTQSAPPFSLAPLRIASAPRVPTPSRDSTLPDQGPAPTPKNDRSDTPDPPDPRASVDLPDAPVPWAKVLGGVALGALLLAGVIVVGLVRQDHRRIQRMSDAGAPAAWGQAAQGVTEPAGDRAVREDPALEGFLRRWSRAVGGERGAEDLAAFYAPRVSWNSSASIASAADVGRYVTENLRAGGHLRVDLGRSTWITERPESRDVAAACRELPGATGDVVKVRAQADELRPGRIPAIPCPRLQGVYLLRLRRAGGALRICHESWSRDEGICASCPTSAVCPRVR
jgi:serine/threonine protein kinase